MDEKEREESVIKKKKEIFWKSLYYGLFISVVFSIFIGMTINGNISSYSPISSDGLCDVCGADADFIVTLEDQKQVTTNEYCFYHAFGWGAARPYEIHDNFLLLLVVLFILTFWFIFAYAIYKFEFWNNRL